MLYDNARPYIAAHTVEMFKSLGFKIVDYIPPYNPDALSDYHLLGPQKEALIIRGRFLLDQHVKDTISFGLTRERYDAYVANHSTKIFFLRA